MRKQKETEVLSLHTLITALLQTFKALKAYRGEQLLNNLKYLLAYLKSVIVQRLPCF